MKNTYAIHGMTCEHCVRRVKQALEGVEGVQSADVTLEPPRATVAMHHQVSTEALNEAVAAVGNYHLETADHSQHPGHAAQGDGEKKNHAGQDAHRHHQMDDEDEHTGHDNHAGHHEMMIADFKKRFWVSLALTVPVLLLAPMIQEWLGVEWRFAGDRYIAFVLSSIIFFYGGWPFLTGLVDELKKGRPGMMTLIALAITVAFVYSSAVVFGLEGKTFFWELATLIVVMLVGHWLEMRSILGASKALKTLAELMPNEAHRIDDNGEVQEVKVSALSPGDLILIKPGEKIPADGEVAKGDSEVNESMLTGESNPVAKSKGSTVIGGSINGNGSLQVQVRGTGKESYLAKVITMVEEAQGRKSKTQRLADQAALWLTIVALVVGIGTFVAWLAMGRELSWALERMVTVMVITCPHALGLAIPLVVAISTSISAKNGLLIRNRTAFENSRKVSTIVFDKTGTLTTGKFSVNRFAAVGEMADRDILRLASALEATSEHPIAQGIMAKVKELEIDPPETKNFQAITGQGVEATVEGSSVKVVSPGYLRKQSIDLPEGAETTDGETIVFVLQDEKLVGYIALADTVRPESKEAIDTLHANGIKIVMLTGDAEAVAKKVAKELGIDDYFAEVLPENKLKKIKELQADGEFVAMAGDGVNDAPALAQADVGIAVGSGTDVAAETADIILVESDPKDIVSLLLFGKATYRKMVQNLIWATGYNVVAIPLATGFVPGLVISPAIGAALMSLSTIICAANAQLLRGSLHR